jgi:hypothetical protein
MEANIVETEKRIREAEERLTSLNGYFASGSAGMLLTAAPLLASTAEAIEALKEYRNQLQQELACCGD